MVYINGTCPKIRAIASECAIFAPRTGKPVVTRGRKASAPEWVERLPNGLCLNFAVKALFAQLNHQNALMGSCALSIFSFLPKKDASSEAIARQDILKYTVCGMSATLVIGSALIYMSYAADASRNAALFLDEGRDYRISPFDMADATRYCDLKTKSRYGDDLAQTYIDDHSTRKDSRSGIYKIFMVAHVGGLNGYEETSIHCFVDPERRVLTHYRAIDLTKTSLVSRAVKFFK